MMLEAIMDKDGFYRCRGFNKDEDAIKFIRNGLDNGDFTEQDIIYKDYVSYITTSFLRPIYLAIFGSDKKVFFKDYVTNRDIIYSPELDRRFKRTVPFQNMYWVTFSSLYYFLKEPDFIVIYKKNNNEHS